MKKILFVTAFAVLGLVMSNAQTEQGKWFISGNTSASFASTKATLEVDGNEGDETTLSNISLTPSVNYFVIDNLAVGLDLQFTSAKTDDGNNDVTTNTFAVLPGATYFFNGDSLKPYVGLNAGLFSTSQGDEDELKSSGFGLVGKGGVAYFINESIAINGFVQYQNVTFSNKANSDVKTKNSGIGIGVGFSLFL